MIHGGPFSHPLLMLVLVSKQRFILSIVVVDRSQEVEYSRLQLQIRYKW